jgi:hypothetical protein
VIREAGATIVAAAQSTTSLVPPLGNDKSKVLTLNLRNRMVFRSADEADAVQAADFLGKKRIVKRSWGSSAGKRNVNYSETEEHKIKPYQIRSLRDHECVLVHCEKGHRRLTLPPLEPNGAVAKWFPWWRQIFWMSTHRPTKKERSRTEAQMRPGVKNLVGIQIRLFRERRGWTQRRLAECFRKEGILVTRDMIASIETQRCAVTDYQIVFFARVLGVCWKSLFPNKTILENLTPPAALTKESEVTPNTRTKRPTPNPSTNESAKKWSVCEMTCKSVKITFRGRS